MKATPNIFCNCRNSCYFVCLIRMQNIIEQKLNTPKVKYFSNEKSPAAWWIITLSTIIKNNKNPMFGLFCEDLRSHYLANFRENCWASCFVISLLLILGILVVIQVASWHNAKPIAICPAMKTSLKNFPCLDEWVPENKQHCGMVPLSTEQLGS